jgi:peptidyl-prolyl cis-trans isomerase A (cyclophilin A)
MHRLRYLGAFWLVAGLLVASGCSKTGEAPAEGSTAAIPSSSGSGESSGSLQNEEGSDKANRPGTDTRFPIVQIETSMGAFCVKLDRTQAPLTVDHFLTNVRNGVYSGTIFHRVWKGYVVMGGGYTADRKERPQGLPVRHEGRTSKMKNLRGTIAMERKPEAIDSASNAFFINLSDNANLDYVDLTPEKSGYCVFGQVTDDGMAVLDKIGQVEVAPEAGLEQLPKQTVTIVSVRWIR